MSSFGTRIRDMRRELGLTQLQVADRTGVSNTYISALESGRKPAPPHAIVTALAACFQTTEEALWKLARAEREEHLRQRIDGIPTSQRTARARISAIDNLSSGSSTQELDHAIQVLKDHASDPKQRRSLANTLEKLAKSLRGNG